MSASESESESEVMCPCGCGLTYEFAVLVIMKDYLVDQFTAEVLLLQAAEKALEKQRKLEEMETDDDGPEG